MGRNFFTGVILILLLYIVLSYSAFILLQLDGDALRGLFFSGILGTVNIVVVSFTIKFVQDEDAVRFNKRFLTIMGMRFIGLLLAIVLIIKYANVDQFSFLASFFVLYFKYQIWEVYFLNQNFNRGNKPL